MLTTSAAFQWKVLVVDTQSKKLLDNAVAEDDILNQNIASESPPAPSQLSYQPNPAR